MRIKGAENVLDGGREELPVGSLVILADPRGDAERRVLLKEPLALRRQPGRAVQAVVGQVQVDDLAPEPLGIVRVGVAVGRELERNLIVGAAVEGPGDVAQVRGGELDPAIGNVKITRLTVAQVEAMLRQMAADGYATSTISRTRSVLRRAIRRAMRDSQVGRNVAELADIPHGGSRPSQSMTVAEVRQLLAASLTPWWRAYIVTAVMLGLRPGEMLGLRWEDVDSTAACCGSASHSSSRTESRSWQTSRPSGAS